MNQSLIARFGCRAVLTAWAVASLAPRVLATEDPDVFELLTGRSVATSLPASEVVETGVYVEPLLNEAADAFVLLSQAEEVPPKEVTPPPASSVMALNRPIGQVSVTAAMPAVLESEMQRIPKEFQIGNPAEAQFGDWSDPRYSAMAMSSGYSPSAFCWAAPAVFHRPLYFEQPNVERYGHYVSVCKGGNCLQSAVCAAHFFGTVPLLPYKVGADPCCERQYVLGCYRPGSCNPHQLVKPEVSCRGLVLQGVTVTGLVFLIP